MSAFSDFALVTTPPRLRTVPLHAGWTVVVWDGRAAVIYQWVAEAQSWRSYRPGAPAILSAFDTFASGASYWIAVTEAIDWTVALAPP